MLTREEIRHHLWGDAAYLDHERGINSALLHLRKALDDDPQSPRFIETVPRHGYRFIAPVELSETPLVSVRTPVGDSADAGPKRWPRIAALTAVLVVLLGLSALWGRLGTVPGAASPPRLVVYPMQDSSEGTDTRPSPLSLTDALVRSLVTEHADRFDLTAPEPADPEGATAGANQPDADLLVMSSLTFDEHGDYGITITLVRASDRTIVWAQTHHLPTEQLASWPELAASDLVTAIDGLPTA